MVARHAFFFSGQVDGLVYIITLLCKENFENNNWYSGIRKKFIIEATSLSVSGRYYDGYYFMQCVPHFHCSFLQ